VRKNAGRQNARNVFRNKGKRKKSEKRKIADGKEASGTEAKGENKLRDARNECPLGLPCVLSFAPSR